MSNLAFVIAGLVFVMGVAVCSISAGMGVLGGVLGLGAIGDGYEITVKKKDCVEEDFKARKIDQSKSEMHEDQVARNPLLQ